MSATTSPATHPAWFGAVLGTGALSLVAVAHAELWSADALVWVSGAIGLLATLAAGILAPRYLRRLRDRTAARAELADPGHGASLATVPAGLVILATVWGRVGSEFLPPRAAAWVAVVLLTLGATIGVLLGAQWAHAILRSDVGLEGVNGAWLIPPVQNLLVPVALAPIATAFPGTTLGLRVIGWAFFGIGVVLFLSVMALFIARLALRSALPAAMAPSMWIPLAPAGVIGVAAFRLLPPDSSSGVLAPAVIVAAMSWGFGVWWSVFAGFEMRQLRAAGPLPRHPGWWGFVFPVAAMTIVTTLLAQTTEIVALRWVSALLGVVLVVLWGTVARVTVPLLRR